MRRARADMVAVCGVVGGGRGKQRRGEMQRKVGCGPSKLRVPGRCSLYAGPLRPGLAWLNHLCGCELRSVCDDKGEAPFLGAYILVLSAASLNAVPNHPQSLAAIPAKGNFAESALARANWRPVARCTPSASGAPGVLCEDDHVEDCGAGAAGVSSVVMFKISPEVSSLWLSGGRSRKWVKQTVSWTPPQPMWH